VNSHKKQISTAKAQIFEKSVAARRGRRLGAGVSILNMAADQRTLFAWKGGSRPLQAFESRVPEAIVMGGGPPFEGKTGGGLILVRGERG